MLLNYDLTINLKINTLMDLNKLKQFEESSNLKVNRSQLAREMRCGRNDKCKRKRVIKERNNLRLSSEINNLILKL